jgi:hypothetical protein
MAQLNEALELADRLKTQGRLTEAKALQLKLQEAPTQGLVEMADSLKTQGRLTKAEEVYSIVLQIQPDCQEATEGLVEIDRRRKEYEKVVKINKRKQEMRKAIALSLAGVEQQQPLQGPEEEILKQATALSPQEIERRKHVVGQAIALSLGQACSSCPEGHQLELSGEDKGGWRCDVCGEGRSEEGWRCEEDKRWGRGGECDYDVCSGCRQEYKVSGGGREEVRVYSRLTLYQT